MSGQVTSKPNAVYTPGNEPYLGRETVFTFDNLIVACLEANKSVASTTHTIALSDLQQAGCKIIPQGVSIALSIRELIRQGYLFGAQVLIRPLAERSTILLYLHSKPEMVEVWKRGWKHKERPSFAAMLQDIEGNRFAGSTVQIRQLYNSLIHGDPESAQWNLVDIGNGRFGYGVSKMLNNPDLCDSICLETMPWLCVLMGMMEAIFPEHTDK